MEYREYKGLKRYREYREVIHAFGKSVNIRPHIKAPVAVTIQLFQL